MTAVSPGDVSPPRGDGGARILEVVGVGAVLVCLGAFLLRSHGLVVVSEPMQWYLAGHDFAARSAETPFAYGFPLLVYAALGSLGPLRAYLVNLPLVLAMAGLLYLFARQQVRPREPAAAVLAGTAALAMLVLVDARLLLGLVNPFRDALSYVFLLLSALLLIRSVGRPRRARLLAAAAGVALAAATSTRETSLLMAIPLGLYLLASSRVERPVRLGAPSLAFAVAFAVGCAPLLIQGQLAGGAGPAAWEGGLAGLRLAQLPRVVDGLAARHGPFVLLLVALGVVLAAWRRQTAVLTLSVPALCLYVLFYGASAGRVNRSLFVADLFVFCIAGAGVAILADLILSSLRRPRAATLGALALGFAAVAAVTLQARGPSAPLRLDGLGRFVRDVEAAVPDGASLVAMQPLGDLLRAFSRHDPESVLDLWDLHRRLPQLFDAEDRRVIVSRGGAAEEIVASAFDIAVARAFDPADYGLDRQLGEEPIVVGLVVPWTSKETTLPLVAGDEREYLLDLELGRRDPRSLTLLFWNGERVEQELVAGLNHVAVSALPPPSVNFLRLVSDRPLPAEVGARLSPLRWPVTLEFAGQRLLRHAERFSASFLQRPRLGFPSVAARGHIDVPTLRPAQAAYVVKAEIALVPRRQAYERTVVIDAGEQTLGDRTLHAEPDDGSGPGWRSISFVLHEPTTTDPRTRLSWSVRDAPRASGEPTLAVREISVQRVPLRERLRIDLAEPRSRVFLAGGFRVSEPRLGRWTGERAGLRLLIQPSPRPGVISLRYVSAPTLSGPAPRPSFLFDGSEVHARFDERDGYVNTFIPLAAGALDAVDHRLEIVLPEGTRRGILVDSVQIGPWGASRGADG